MEDHPEELPMLVDPADGSIGVIEPAAVDPTVASRHWNDFLADQEEMRARRPRWLRPQ